MTRPDDCMAACMSSQLVCVSLPVCLHLTTIRGTATIVISSSSSSSSNYSSRRRSVVAVVIVVVLVLIGGGVVVMRHGFV